MLGNVILHKVEVHILENVLALGSLNKESEAGEFSSCISECLVFVGTVDACFLLKGLADLDCVLLEIDGNVCHGFIPF